MNAPTLRISFMAAASKGFIVSQVGGRLIGVFEARTSGRATSPHNTEIASE
jgi:hypothetical protein